MSRPPTLKLAKLARIQERSLHSWRSIRWRGGLRGPTPEPLATFLRQVIAGGFRVQCSIPARHRAAKNHFVDSEPMRVHIEGLRLEFRPRPLPFHLDSRGRPVLRVGWTRFAEPRLVVMAQPGGIWLFLLPSPHRAARKMVELSPGRIAQARIWPTPRELREARRSLQERTT